MLVCLLTLPHLTMKCQQKIAETQSTAYHIIVYICIILNSSQLVDIARHLVFGVTRQYCCNGQLQVSWTICYLLLVFLMWNCLLCCLYHLYILKRSFINFPNYILQNTSGDDISEIPSPGAECNTGVPVSWPKLQNKVTLRGNGFQAVEWNDVMMPHYQGHCDTQFVYRK